MHMKFKTIGIVGYPRYASSFVTHVILYNWLIKKGYDVVVENGIASFLNLQNLKTATSIEIGCKCDIAIVIGGDGNMLYFSRIFAYYSIKIIGINRGNLGFLTDLNPDNMLSMLSDILSGSYSLEDRFLLESCILHSNKKKVNIAVNEVVLQPMKTSNIIEFSVYINKKFAFYQRSDGLIISTPTGSTGYSLSAGGPILSISLDGILIIPMFPHTLSSRPIVINNSSLIMLKLCNLKNKVVVSCDGNIVLSINYETEILIYKSRYYISYIHHKKYSYLDFLRSKLKWLNNFF